MNKIKLLGHEITIVLDPNLPLNTDQSIANANCATNKITVNPNTPKSVREEGVLHELIEMINWKLGLKIEHHVFSTLSEILYAVLVDNGMKTDWGIDAKD